MRDLLAVVVLSALVIAGGVSVTPSASASASPSATPSATGSPTGIPHPCHGNCSYDSTVCQAGGCMKGPCPYYQYCDVDWMPELWRQSMDNVCYCPKGRAGVDCGIVEPPPVATASGANPYCDAGEVWDGVPFPFESAPKKLECFIDHTPHMQVLSLRLHRVDVVIGPLVNDTTSVQWTLRSRHWNKTIPAGAPNRGYCLPMVVDMGCNLTQCAVSANDHTCGSIEYSCGHAHCYSEYGGFIELYVAALNQPGNWPIHLKHTEVNNATGMSNQALVTSGITLELTCQTGTCTTETPLCDAPPLPGPPPVNKAAYFVLAGSGGGVAIGALLAAACICLAQRPAKRNKGTHNDGGNDSSFVEFASADAGLGRSDSIKSAASPMPGAPPMGIVFQDVTYDVVEFPTLSWKQWVCSLCTGGKPTRKRVLHGVSGVVKPRELVALMGPSGAGKSSLLDILASHEKSGDVNGNVEYHWDRYRVDARRVDDGAIGHTGVAGVGYVYQDDRLLPTETVRETLLFSARMRLPRHLSEATINHRVNEVIASLELRHVADSRIGSPDAGGGISGGERKRVAIGVELLASPRIMLLDEPTTGLDSHSVNVVMRVLRDTAHSGCACVVSIHQPTSSTFRSFDRVVLLTKGGRLAFCGPPMVATSHFVALLGVPAPRIRGSTGGSSIVHGLPPVDSQGNLVEAGTYGATATSGHRPAMEFKDEGSDSDDEALMMNPAETLLDAAAVGSPADADRLQAAFRASEAFGAVASQIQAVQSSCSAMSPDGLARPKQGSSSWLDSVNQFAQLCRRGFRQMLRTPALLLTQIGLTVVVAGCLSALFYHLPYDLNGAHNRTGVLFFNIVYFSLAATSSLGVLILEKHTFFRERARGYYSTAPYFLSKVVVDLLPLRVVPPMIYGAITYPLMHLNPQPTRMAIFLIGMCLVNCAAACSCYVISAYCSSLGKANLAASLYFVFNVLFGGLLLTGRNAVISGLMYASMFSYGFQMLMMNEFYLMDRSILFNPRVVVTPGTKQTTTPIPGEEWLVNWGIDGRAHPDLAYTNMVALAAWVVCLLLAAFALLAFHQRYVK